MPTFAIPLFVNTFMIVGSHIINPIFPIWAKKYNRDSFQIFKSLKIAA